MADNGSKASAQAKTEKTEALWTVLDSNCKHGEARSHEIIVDGAIRPYPFGYQQPVPMPEGHARKFMHDPAFIVQRPDGQRVKAEIPITRGFDADGKLKLADDECVARLEELSMESLLGRAAPLAGGEKLTLKSGKKLVIQFLIDARKKKLTSNLSPEKRESDAESEEMTAGELDRMRLEEIGA